MRNIFTHCISNSNVRCKIISYFWYLYAPQYPMVGWCLIQSLKYNIKDKYFINSLIRHINIYLNNYDIGSYYFLCYGQINIISLYFMCLIKISWWIFPKIKVTILTRVIGKKHWHIYWSILKPDQELFIRLPLSDDMIFYLWIA